MSSASALPAFTGVGVEIEYMIVDARLHDVAPIADRLLFAACGEYQSEIERGPLAWSNELALHVVELKTNGPAASLEGLATVFQHGVTEVNALLSQHGAKLMPTGMHPWMDPASEMRLWPHEYNEIYETYNRIFDCSGHGWANLQSVHLNLPFADDAEFARLHTAIRLLLPILPALAASSPIVDGAPSGSMDTRLQVYRNNARRIPSITGVVIPEAVTSRAQYDAQILAPMYADIAGHDPRGILQHEWLNSRGAIARFDRNTIEIRVLDTQECPAADLAIASLLDHVLRALFENRWLTCERQAALGTPALAAVFDACSREADAAPIADADYLAAFAYPGRRASAVELWWHLLESVDPGGAASGWTDTIRGMLREGPLARRILAACAKDFRRERIREVYAALCGCLANGELFHT